MIRFTDITAGRYSRFEPTFSHFVITAIVFAVAYFVSTDYRLAHASFLVPLVLVPVLFISSIGLVIGFGSIRYPKMIMVQALVIAFLIAQVPRDFATKAMLAITSLVFVYFFASKLCLRFLKLRNIWETCTGITAFAVIYPYTYRSIAHVLF